MPLYVWLIVFHPVPVTLLALVVLVLLLRWTGWWARYKYRILLVLLAAYAIDTAFALPRILFAYGLSKSPVIAQQIPLPRRLVLVDVPCDAKCHDWLIAGAIDEILFVRSLYASAPSSFRYKSGWTLPGTCPGERENPTRDPRASQSEEQRRSGYCPLVEPVDIPHEGIFLVRELTRVTANERARVYTPTYLIKAPAGPVIRFAGIEVQNRTPDLTTVLASAYRYEAPGLLGLPPLIGCWDRPDNVIWIMPPGDTGCGFWRWFTWGGDDAAVDDPKWLFERVFGPPDHPVVPPARLELPAPTPAQALEILSKVLNSDSDFHLARLRDALLDPANSDQTLAELVVRRTQYGTLDGSLIALLAAKRPASLVGLPSRLAGALPRGFAQSGAVLDEMENNPTFRDDFAGTALAALATAWPASENIDRFLNLMEDHHPGWLCDRLGRIKGSAEVSKILENPAVKRNSTQCSR